MKLIRSGESPVVGRTPDTASSRGSSPGVRHPCQIGRATGLSHGHPRPRTAPRRACSRAQRIAWLAYRPLELVVKERPISSHARRSGRTKTTRPTSLGLSPSAQISIAHSPAGITVVISEWSSCPISTPARPRYSTLSWTRRSPVGRSPAHSSTVTVRTRHRRCPIASQRRSLGMAASQDSSTRAPRKRRPRRPIPTAGSPARSRRGARPEPGRASPRAR